MSEFRSNHATAVVLAAGQGKRMRVNRPKVLTKVLGQEMITYILDSLKNAGIDRPIVVVGYEGQQVVDIVQDNAVIAWQREQLGTGHAVQMALPQLARIQGSVIVTNGDVPLISSEFFRSLTRERESTGASAIVATMLLDKPKAYGRIKRDEDGNMQEIVEMRDCSPDELLIKEVNTGTYCFDSALLKKYIPMLKTDNAQGELYLTDIIRYMIQDSHKVRCLVSHDPDEFLGINDPADLMTVEQGLGARIRARHLGNGVVIQEPSTVRIEPHVKIGPRTVVRPGAILEGYATIGADCIIGPHVRVSNIDIPDGTVYDASGISGKKKRTW